MSEVTSTLVGMQAIDPEEPQGPEAAEAQAASPRAAKPPPRLAPVTRPRVADEPAFLPEPPRSIAATGLSASYLESLCLKHLFQAGDLRGSEIAARTCLPASIIEEVMERLRRMRLVDLKGSGGAGLGRSQIIFSMTEAAKEVCDLSMERDRYVGPAPIPFKYYLQAVAAQTIRGSKLRREDLAPHFSELVVDEAVFDSIGPAMNSGKALFFYGPPGNGKTAICQRMTGCFGGDVFVPHAIIVDDFVIKVFDETLHKPVPRAEGGPALDERWVRCRRPMVVVGGELTLDDLDLSYSPDVKYYEAPFQLKANCGMLLVDDFGRQKVSPGDLLNRWIVPLESEFDFLTMHTGKKLQVPFDVFVVFSTNLDPGSLVDAAFLRRVRYKLEVRRPDAKQFGAIFAAECQKKGVRYDPQMVDYLIAKHYLASHRPFNACEPRDLLGQVIDLCAYRGHEPGMTQEILDRVVANYFVKFD
ncbi:MAG: ATPase [Deltaproteobacteria bacterium]|nr:ATPase [Deltaproteobacteria bacterium]